jgi:hypothetical protein
VAGSYTQIAVWRKSWIFPTTAAAVVLGLMAVALAWALGSGRGPGSAALTIGMLVFGGTFILSGIGAIALVAEWPRQTHDALLREAARGSLSRWKRALLTETGRWIEIHYPPGDSALRTSLVLPRR